jgi:L-serine dehydratase
MNYSVFEVFRIGVGPSSSHTVGPMSAANMFLSELNAGGVMSRVTRVRARLYGSLALTGVGHATDFAVIAGLLGEIPEDVDPPAVQQRVADVRDRKRLKLGFGGPLVDFDVVEDLVFHKDQFLAEHPNGMVLEAFDKEGVSLHHNAYFSIGGGAVLDRAQITAKPQDSAEVVLKPVPYPFGSAAELLAQCKASGLTIPELIWRNELVYQDEAATRARLMKVWGVMQMSLDRGLSSTEQFLPGGLKVRRRAPTLYKRPVRRTAATSGRWTPSARSQSPSTKRMPAADVW